jgi:hypothetical protein
MPLTLQEVSDRIEIDDLLVRYTRAIDDKDWALLDTVFLPDADVDYTTSGGIKGKYPEVRDWLAKALAAFPITLHAISNSTIELDGDRATGKTLVNNPMVIPKEGGAQTRFTVWAWYVDELVRTDDGWRIAKRFEEQVFVDGGLPAGLEIPE